MIRRSRFLLAVWMCVPLLLSSPLIASCSQNQAADYNYFRVTVDGQQALGVSADNTIVRAVVVFFHDVGGDEFTMTTGQAQGSVTSELVNAGFGVVSSNAGGDSWGDPASQQNYIKIAMAAAAHYKTENFFFLADSMGALAAVNILAMGPAVKVRGMAAINPILDLDAVTAQYKSKLDEVYLNQPRDVSNPMKLPVESMSGRKMKFFVSDGDTRVPPQANALAFQARFGSVADIEIVNCSGDHGDLSCFQGEEVVKWYTAQERRTG